MEIPKELKDELWDYCRLNNITNIDEFTLKLLKQGYTIEKYGATPISNTIEKIVEKIVEVPVEKIVEKIVEVPIQMDNTKLLEEYRVLLKENENLKKQLEEEKNKKKNNLYGDDSR